MGKKETKKSVDADNSQKPNDTENEKSVVKEEPEKQPEQKEKQKDAPAIVKRADEASYKTKLQRTKEALAKQPKVRIIIPREKGETEGAYETVQINGYLFQIKKGVYVEVPEQVAQIIMESQQQTEEAIAKALRGAPDGERMEFDNSQS